jgi:zinc transport system substrate-binding protein
MRSRRNFVAVFGLLLVVLFCWAMPGCSKPPDPWKAAKTGQKHILVSFPPLYCLTQAIAGGDAYVICMLTATGPHDVQANITDAFKVNGADLVILNGLELDERFMNKLIKSSSNKAVPTLEVGEAIPDELLLPMEEEKDEPKQGKDDKHVHAHHHHGEHDPHIWLGPPQAVAMVEVIAAKLGEIDSANAAGYKKRAEQLVGELKKLQEDGKATFQAKKGRNVLSMHESLRYFARAFDLNLVGAIQPQAGVDPDGTRIAKLQELCEKKQVNVITYEPQFNPAQSQLLQKQLKGRGLKVELVEIDPLETAPVGADGVNPNPSHYLDTMRKNVEALARALP